MLSRPNSDLCKAQSKSSTSTAVSGKHHQHGMGWQHIIYGEREKREREKSYRMMRKQLCVELLSKITRKNVDANLVSPKSTWNPFHQRSFSHYSTLSRSHLRKICTSNAVSGTAPNAVPARRFFSGKFPVSFRNARFFHSMGRRRRSMFGWLTTDGVVLGLIIANVGVFVLWKVANPEFMVKNFMISVDNFTSGRLHTLITSAFSQKEPSHIVGNMIGLYVFGTSIGQFLGPQYLLKLYLTGAIAGSISYLAYHAFIAPSLQIEQKGGICPSKIPGLGASGAVNAIMLLDIFLFPTKTLYFDMLIPMPAIFVGIVIIGHDILRAWRGDSRVSGSAHLGGATVSALAWLRLRKNRRFRRF